MRSCSSSPLHLSSDPSGSWLTTTTAPRRIDSDHKVDGIRPTLSRADADPNDLTKIILTFSEAIGTAAAPGSR